MKWVLFSAPISEEKKMIQGVFSKELPVRAVCELAKKIYKLGTFEFVSHCAHMILLLRIQNAESMCTEK